MEKPFVASLIKLFNPYLDMTKSHSQTLSLVLDKISLTNVSYVAPTVNHSSASHGVRCEVYRAKKVMSKITYIAKEDLTEILDNVFSKYNIKISSGTTNVIKSTKATKAKKTKPKTVESDSYVIDGEQFTFNGVIVTKGDTYKNQTKGGKKLHTVVVQVTEEQKDAWTEWRKA